MKSVLMKKFAQDGARVFSDVECLQQVLEGSTMNRIEYCKHKDGVICVLRAIQGCSGGIAVDPNIMVYVLNPQHWKKDLYQRGRSCDCQSVLECGWVPGGKEKDKRSSGCFPDTDKSSLEKTQRTKELVMISQFHRKVLL